MPDVTIPPGPSFPGIPPLRPINTRPTTPRNLADIRLRLVVRLNRKINPRGIGVSRGGGLDLQPVLDAAKNAYPRFVPRKLVKRAVTSWGFSIEPAFPGATFKHAHRLWSYYIVSFPATRGTEVGWMWDLAHAIVQDAKIVELAYPESFGDRYKLLSSGAGAVAPGDMAWSLRQIKVPQARAFAASQGMPAGGEGIVVGHLDTGWARHAQLEPGSVDEARQRNMLSVAVFPPRIEAANDAIDPYTGPLDIFHAHGLATASVLASRGEIFPPNPASLAPAAPLKSGTGTAQSGTQSFFTGAGPNQWGQNAEVVGVAPGATILPIRCSDSVALTGDIEIAQAVWYACQQNVDVITMSLGGVPSPLLHVAMAHAVNAKNIIFCAAAGNLTPFVVFPAAYAEAIACAGSQPDGKPWRAVYGSSFGPQVDVSAPAQGVWIADMQRANNADVPIVKPGEGTSFATPAVAGAAAAWLAFHNRAALLARYPGIPLQDVFRTLLKRTSANLSGEAVWPRDFGAGVLDLDRLLREPLPAPADVERADPWSPDAFLGYLADGVAAAATAAGASRLPPGAAGIMVLLELAQLLFSNTEFGKDVRDFSNNVQRTAEAVVDDIGRFLKDAANEVSQFFKNIFGP